MYSPRNIPNAPSVGQVELTRLDRLLKHIGNAAFLAALALPCAAFAQSGNCGGPNWGSDSSYNNSGYAPDAYGAQQPYHGWNGDPSNNWS
jgi:hypothetical protein